MIFHFVKILFLGLIVAASPFGFAGNDETDSAKTIEKCSGIKIILESEDFKLTSMEQALVCPGKSGPDWKDLPNYQQRYFIKAFLQGQGFHFPEFIEEKNLLLVKTGPVSKARHVVIENNPIGVDPQRHWPTYGSAMTPAVLDDLENWLKEEYAKYGYPCMKPMVIADPKKESIKVVLERLVKHKFGPVESENIRGIRGNIQSRYQAFSEGDSYNALKLDLTSQRIMAGEIVLNANYITLCEDDGNTIKIKQKLLSTKPNLFTVGFGADTEEYGVVMAKWKNVRLMSNASNTSIAVRTSYRQQKLFSDFNWYYAPIVTKHYLHNAVEYIRETEEAYESTTIDARSGPVWYGDDKRHYYETWAGIAYEHLQTQEGEGPNSSTLVSPGIKFILQSHSYEYYQASPRKGYHLEFGILKSKKDMGSDVSTTRFNFSLKWLKNLYAYEPPIWVWGVRLSYQGIRLDDDSEKYELPTQIRHRLGGSQNLRGFGRKKIGGDAGSLSAGYIGTELRLNNVLAYGLQPIIFADFGKVGTENVYFDKELYWSPGAGIHWSSPIGVMRATLAHGFVESSTDPARFNHQERWQFYFSFGEFF